MKISLSSESVAAMEVRFWCGSLLQPTEVSKLWFFETVFGMFMCFCILLVHNMFVRMGCIVVN
ncbi:hypothetical protein Hdeb2414_s0001g00007731 [Helianthus debilis subsp. tardiflorus]